MDDIELMRIQERYELENLENFIKERGFTLLNTTSEEDLETGDDRITQLVFSDLKEHSIQCELDVIDYMSAQFSHVITKDHIRIEGLKFGRILYDGRFDEFYNNIKEIVEKIYKE